MTTTTTRWLTTTLTAGAMALLGAACAGEADQAPIYTVELAVPNPGPDFGEDQFPPPDHGNPGFPQDGAKLPGTDRGLDAFPRQLETGVVRPEGGLVAVPPTSGAGGVVAQPQAGAKLGTRAGLDAFPLELDDTIEIPDGGLVAVPPSDADGVRALPQPGATQLRPPSLSVAGFEVEAAVANQRFVFVTTSDEPALRGLDRATGATVVITSDSDASVPMGVTMDDAFVYWTDLGTGDVLRADLATFTVEAIARGELAPHGIAVEGGVVSWTNLGEDAVHSVRLR